MLLLQLGKNALHYACSNGHTEVVKHLINSNANILASTNVSDYVVCLCIFPGPLCKLNI